MAQQIKLPSVRSNLNTWNPHKVRSSRVFHNPRATDWEHYVVLQQMGGRDSAHKFTGLSACYTRGNNKETLSQMR